MCQAYNNILNVLKIDIESLYKESVQMAKKQEIHLAPGQNHKNEFTAHKKGMPTIRCICGARILVIPDLKAMNCAIKNHIAEHKKADYGLALDSLEEFLTERILIAASIMSLPNES